MGLKIDREAILGAAQASGDLFDTVDAAVDSLARARRAATHWWDACRRATRSIDEEPGADDVDVEQTTPASRGPITDLEKRAAGRELTRQGFEVVSRRGRR